MNEFESIDRYFRALTVPGSDVLLGIGDDCALLRPPPGEDLAVTTDTLIGGRHFPDDAAPYDIGWKALAVNLSDLAAMGARPRWFTLALSVLDIDQVWLQAFAEGLGALATQAGIALVGGDTTRGPLSLTITAIGTTTDPAAMRRAGARPGDAVCVTGTLGDAALGLGLWQQRISPKDINDGDRDFLYQRLHRPQPRIAEGLRLRSLAHAAIDLSDGLAGDLGHILSASGVGAVLHADRLPASPAFDRHAPAAERLALQAAGGDDYELCLCLPPERLDEARRTIDLPLTEIGRITAEPGLRWLDASGNVFQPTLRGYDHFQ